jgi:hypothetical protein
MKQLIIDIHAHPQLKPVNSGDAQRKLKGIWKKFDESEYCGELNNQLRKSLKETKKTSQSNFDQAITGNVRGVFLAMGPVERNFFKPKPRHLLLKLVLKRSQYKNLAACITGFDMDKVDKIFRRIENKKGVDYFNEELVDEYIFLTAEAEKSQQSPNTMVIAGDYREFKEHISNENTITTVLTVEGAHSIGNYSEDADFSRNILEANDNQLYNRLMGDFKKNIGDMKKWGGGRHAPFLLQYAIISVTCWLATLKAFHLARAFLSPVWTTFLIKRREKMRDFLSLGGM